VPFAHRTRALIYDATKIIAAVKIPGTLLTDVVLVEKHNDLQDEHFKPILSVECEANHADANVKT